MTPLHFARDYFLWVYIAAIGTLQVAAAIGHLRGLLFVRNRRQSVVLGTALAVGATLWFFLSWNRNQPDTGLGLDGNKQAALFVAATALALVSTLVFSSLRNRKRLGLPKQVGEGLDALRQTTWTRAVAATLSERRERRPRP